MFVEQRNVWLTMSRVVNTKTLGQKVSYTWYMQSKLTPGHWTHKTRPIQFCLVVDNLGVKYMGKSMQFIKNNIRTKLRAIYKLGRDEICRANNPVGLQQA